MQATLTILFTDAVASTEALARLGDERFEQVQAAHLDLLRARVESEQGREVKSLGDGLMVTFGGAADALACAVAMQQAIEAADRGGEEGLPLRVGVSAGDVSVADDGDRGARRDGVRWTGSWDGGEGGPSAEAGQEGARGRE